MAATTYDLKRMRAYLLKNDYPLPPRNLSVSDFETWARKFGYDEPNVGDDLEFEGEGQCFITYLNAAIAITLLVFAGYLIIQLS